MTSTDNSGSAQNGRSNSLSRFRRSLRRSHRKKSPERVVEKLEPVETTDNNHSDGERLQNLLKNLNLRFEECTFTYKLEHFETEPRKKERSRLGTLKSRIFDSLGKVRESMTNSEKTYDRCLFFPANEKTQVKNYLHENFSDLKLTFENCKFIKRSTTITEKMAIRLRKFFGLQFELEYIGCSASIDHYTFRLKDIQFAYEHIQERIIEEA